MMRKTSSTDNLGLMPEENTLSVSPSVVASRIVCRMCTSTRASRIYQLDLAEVPSARVPIIGDSNIIFDANIDICLSA